MNQLVEVAGNLFGMIRKEIPDVQIRPIPSLELLYPEIKLLPERDRLRASGLSAEEFGVAIDVLMDGRKIGEFKQEGQTKVDVVLKASEKNIASPEALYQAMIATPGGRIVPASSLSELVKTTGITEVRHFERKRTVTLQVTPPVTLSLQEAMERIESRVIRAVRSQGFMEGVTVGMSGVADKLWSS